MDEVKNEKKIILPILSNLTVIGILIYYLGWRYWEGYYSYFSIQTSLIEISFEKIILTTWSRIFGLLIIFSFAWDDLWKDKEQRHVTGPTLSILGLIILFQLEFKYFWYILIGIAIVLLVIFYVLRKRKFQFSTLSHFQLLAILGTTMYLFGIYHYAKNGRKDAEKLFREFEDNVEIKMSDQTVITGKFITFMNGKYFIIIEDKKCKKNIVAIEGSQTITATFANKNK